MSLAALKIEGAVIVAARLGVGGVADRAIRLSKLEQELVGKAPSRELFQDIAASARAGIRPTADIHGSAEYRSDLIRTVVLRALTEAAAS
jgi:aerobic carbon-monoxide dehydrogenase medium subunit